MRSARALRAAAAVLAVLLASVAGAQATWPVHPVRIIVPFPPGGTSDILARSIGQKLSERLGQPVIVDNRPGAGANIGAETAAKSSPDGYTLLLMSTIHVINPSLYAKLAYDPTRDFAAITLIATTAQVLVVHPSLPVKTVAELIAYAKARPGALYYSSAGNGSQPHLSAEIFKWMTGIDIVHVPYKGAPQAMTDLVAGQVALTFATAPSAVPLVRSAQVRALAVTTRGRITALPDVPTMIEAGVAGYEAVGWNGLVAPAGTPSAIVDRLNAEVVGIVGDPAVSRQLSGEGADPQTSTPTEFAAFLESERAKWAEAVKRSGTRVD